MVGGAVVRTYEEALRDCLAIGVRRTDCEETLRDRMVGGVFCDGAVVMSSTGTRCVPAETVARVLAARAADPLERPTPATSSGEGLSPVVIVGAVVAVVAAAFLISKYL